MSLKLQKSFINLTYSDGDIFVAKQEILKEISQQLDKIDYNKSFAVTLSGVLVSITKVSINENIFKRTKRFFRLGNIFKKIINEGNKKEALHT